MSIKDLSKDDAVVYVGNVTEIEEARTIAKDLGVSFSGNTGLDKLKTNIVTKLNEPEKPAETDAEKALREKTEAETKAAEEEATKEKAAAKKAAADAEQEAKDLADLQIAPQPASKKLTVNQMMKLDPKLVKDPTIRRQVIRTQALRKRRVRIQNLDPSETDTPGSIITVVSKYTGKVSEYVPNSLDEGAWHLSQIIIDFLLTKRYVQRRKIPGGKYGVQKYKTVEVKKYAIEFLPNLTEKELAALEEEQKAAGTVGT